MFFCLHVIELTLEVNYGRKSAILNLTKLKFVKAYLKKNANFAHGNDLAIWHCLPDIRHIKVNYGR